MKTLNQYLITESAEEDKLKHLEHAEDHVINAGKEGFKHAFNTLHGVHTALTKNKSEVSLSHKFDGSPSIVFGHNPENGKFFVASKSAFNANPKLNYSDADIEKNHGHAPGLVNKLKAALKHLPKVTPKSGVYQGDVMHTPEDIKHKDHKIEFTPNTISYSVDKNSTEGKKVLGSKIGVAVHTAYKGNSMNDLKAEYNPNLSHFEHNPDVHVLHATMPAHKVEYDEKHQQKFQKHMQKAIELNNKIKDYSHLEDHKIPLKTYINKTVRSGSAPSVQGYKEHLRDQALSAASKVKTEVAKQRKLADALIMVKHINDNKQSFNDTLKVHNELQKAKDTLVSTLSSHKGDYEHHIAGKPTQPEGFVAVHKNRPTKLVNRAEFSRANFEKNK